MIHIDKTRAPRDLLPKIARVFAFSAHRIRSIEEIWRPEDGAPVFTVQGRYQARGWTEWTQGFQFGSALLQFDAEGDVSFLELGRSRTVERMAPHLTHVGVHDHGFNNVSTYGNLWRLARERRIARDQVERRRADASFAASIVFITSVSAELASPNRGEYCVSKAGLSMAARLFAVRLAEHGIPVFEVRPGLVATEMTAGVRDAYDRRIADGLVPERRWGQPEDVGTAVAALLRGDFPYATGTIINVDEGLAIPRL